MRSHSNDKKVLFKMKKGLESQDRKLISIEL